MKHKGGDLQPFDRTVLAAVSKASPNGITFKELAVACPCGYRELDHALQRLRRQRLIVFAGMKVGWVLPEARRRHAQGARL